MSTTERKARKKAGIKFTKAAKTPTPLDERAVPQAFDRNGRTNGIAVQHASKRALKRRETQDSFRTS